MRKILSLFVAVMAVFSLSAKTIYLQPNTGDNSWSNNARYAVYAFDESANEWYDMSAVADHEGIFQATVSDNYPSVIFCRMNPDQAENNWNNRWNQTEDLTVPADKDLYIIAASTNIFVEGNAAGEWSVFNAETPVDPQPSIELPYVALIGGMNDWDGGVNQLVPAEDSLTASATVHLDMNDNQGYAFKILVGSVGLSAHGESGLYGLHKDWTTVKLDWVDVNSDALWLTMNAAGDYTFTFTYADSMLVVTFPEGGDTPQPVLPSVAVAGAFNGWSPTANVMTAAEDSLTASVTINLSGQDYQFKMVVGNSWLCPQAGLFEIKRDFTSVSHVNYGGGENDNLVLKADVAGDYTFTWTFADSTLTVTFPEGDTPQPQNRLENGYYLIGLDMADWKVDYLTADYLFTVNPANEAEYMLNVTLAENQEFQVVSVENDAIINWYPGGEGNNYVVDAAHAGNKTVYFRPDGQGGDDWHHGLIFVELKATITIDIENEVNYKDAVAAEGWWQFLAENDDYKISISNISTTQAAGTYHINDLDLKYTYIIVKATETEVAFVDAELTLSEAEDGSRTIEGTVLGDDDNTYIIKLVFKVPTIQTTVNVEIPEWEVYDATELYEVTSILFMGEAADGTYVQFALLGSNPIGHFTYDDCYNGGIEVDGNWKSVYTMDINISLSDAQRCIVTMDILCLNNTLYHVTTTVGEGINNVEVAVETIKRIVNGQLVIEKNNVRYNAQGAVVR